MASESGRSREGGVRGKREEDCLGAFWDSKEEH